MSSSLIEVVRTNHELSETFEVAIGTELDVKPNGQKAKVLQQHKIDKLVNTIVVSNKEILQMYEDSVLKDELVNMSGSDMFDSFYKNLNSTREYYQKFPDIEIPSSTMDMNDVEVPFSGAEVFGKYFDLNPLYLQFCNLLKKASIDQDYLQYLDRFNSFFYIPESIKATKPYSEYLENLWVYLYDFFHRVNPLINIDDIVKEWSADFKTKVDSGEIKIAKFSKGGKAKSANAPQPLRLGMFSDPLELEALGMDRIKEALEAMGLKCGGTLSDRAQRLWSVRGKKAEDIPNNLRSKPAKRKVDDGSAEEKSESPSDSSNSEEAYSNDISWMEFKATSICHLMMDTVTATRRHAEKQQSRTAEEKEAEIREEEFGLLPDVADGDAVVDDDDDAPIYNPLNLPLGWDGKPIPFWLYKLHGLGVEFKCEICGTQS
jgi:splicing factor 3A subunit 3